MPRSALVAVLLLLQLAAPVCALAKVHDRRSSSDSLDNSKGSLLTADGLELTTINKGSEAQKFAKNHHHRQRLTADGLIIAGSDSKDEAEPKEAVADSGTDAEAAEAPRSKEETAAMRAEAFEKEFTVELNVTHAREVGMPLGVKVDIKSEFQPLSIRLINEGLIQAWNRANPEKEIIVGDQVTKVNQHVWHHNTRLFGERMKSMFQAAKNNAPGAEPILTLSVQRPRRQEAALPAQLLDLHKKLYGKEFEVSMEVPRTKVEKTMADTLGWKLNVSSNYWMPVAIGSIKQTGLVSKWNGENPESKRILPGDEIIKVNNVTWRHNSYAFIEKIVKDFEASRASDVKGSVPLTVSVRRLRSDEGEQSETNMTNLKQKVQLTKVSQTKMKHKEATTSKAMSFMAALPVPKATKAPQSKVFGWQLSYEDDGSPPVIGKIRSNGLVAKWNQAHPEQAVRPGDQIVEVNNFQWKKGNSKEFAIRLGKEFEASSKRTEGATPRMYLRIERRATEETEEEVDTSEASEDTSEKKASEEDSEEKATEKKASEEEASEEKSSEEKASEKKAAEVQDDTSEEKENDSEDKASEDKDKTSEDDASASEDKDSEEKDSKKKDSKKKASEEKDAEEKDSEEKDSEKKDSKKKSSEEKDSEEKDSEEKTSEKKASEEKVITDETSEEKDSEEKDSKTASEKNTSEKKASEDDTSEEKDSQEKTSEEKESEDKATEKKASEKETSKKASEEKETSKDDTSEEKDSEEKDSEEKDSEEKDSEEKDSEEKDSEDDTSAKDSEEKDSEEKDSEEKTSEKKDSEEGASEEKDSEEKTAEEKTSEDDTAEEKAIPARESEDASDAVNSSEAEREALEADRLQERQEMVLDGYPSYPGCFVRLPDGCPNHYRKSHLWRHDVWAEQGKNISDSGCKLRRKYWNEFCGIDNAKVLYIAPPAGEGERQSEEDYANEEKKGWIIDGYPLHHGCYMRMPSGCANHFKKSHLWRHDVWAEERNVNASQCGERRGFWNNFCGVSDAKVVFKDLW